MFDMGFAEMLVIGIVALIVIGPERLPSVARKAGAYFAKIRRFVSNVKSDVEREFRTDELQRMLQQQQEELSSLKDVINETKHDVDLDGIKSSVEDAAQDAIADDSPTQTDTAVPAADSLTSDSASVKANS
jgi:sec-independent protein translocase protein TatB